MKKKRNDARINYVFIDVVQFTRKDRLYEDLVSILDSMNQIVRNALSTHEIEEEDVILIPTGDGVCIGIKYSSKYNSDVHLEVATTIQSDLAQRNDGIQSDGARYELRIAVHEHVDLLVTDINNNRNIAGMGINNAARLVDLCEPGGIVVSEAVYSATKDWQDYRGRYEKCEKDHPKGYTYTFYRLNNSISTSPALTNVNIEDQRIQGDLFSVQSLVVQNGSVLSSEILHRTEGTVAVWVNVAHEDTKHGLRRYRYIVSHTTNPRQNKTNRALAAYSNAWALLRITPNDSMPKGRWEFWCNGVQAGSVKLNTDENISLGIHLFSVCWSKSGNYIRFLIDDVLIGESPFQYWPDSFSGSLVLGNWVIPHPYHKLSSGVGPLITSSKPLSDEQLQLLLEKKLGL